MAIPYSQYLQMHAANKAAKQKTGGSGLLNEGRELENQMKMLELEQKQQEADPAYLETQAINKAKAEAKAAQVAPKPVAPSPSVQGELYNADDTLSGIGTVRDILAKYGKQIDTGKSQAIKGKLRGIFGDRAPLIKQTDSEQQLDALLGKLKSDYLKSFAGTNVTAAEQERLTKFLPDITDSRQQIGNKLKVLEQNVGTFKQNRTGQKPLKDPLGIR